MSEQHLAVVKDGMVVNVIVAPPTTMGAAFQAPDGHQTVALPVNHEVGVGDSYDGTTFAKPQASKQDLKEHAARLPPGLPIGMLTVGDQTIKFDELDPSFRNVLPYLMRAAQRDPTLVVRVPRLNGTLVTLNASQITALEKALGDRYIALFGTVATMFDQIDSGQLTTYSEVKTYGKTATGQTP